MSVTPVNSYSEFRKALEDNKIVVAFFMATWNGPSRAISPHVNSLAAEYSEKVKFVSVDLDAVNGLAQEYGIRAVPNFLLFQNGEKLIELPGANPPRLRKLAEEAAGRY